MLGTRLEPHGIAAVLGAGGMGEVYRATDTNLEREVAIKTLPEDLATDPLFVSLRSDARFAELERKIGLSPTPVRARNPPPT